MFISDRDNSHYESRKGLIFSLCRRIVTGVMVISIAVAAVFASYCIDEKQGAYAMEDSPEGMYPSGQELEQKEIEEQSESEVQSESESQSASAEQKESEECSEEAEESKEYVGQDETAEQGDSDDPDDSTGQEAPEEQEPLPKEWDEPVIIRSMVRGEKYTDPIVAFEGSSNTVTATAPAVSKTVNIRHIHTGNASGGGCYGKLCTEMEEYEVNCKGTLYYWSALGTSQCTVCGASYTGNRDGQSCPHSHMEQRENSYYEMDCNKDESSVTGTFTVTLDTKDWTKKVTSVASYKSTNGLKVQNPAFSLNGTEYSNATKAITKNGTYEFALRTDSNSRASDAKITMKVSNIDNTPPTAKDVYLSAVTWTNKSMKFSLLNAKDLQEDGTPGSGLAEEAYSFDKGKTWTSSNTTWYDENGTYSIYVRDAVGNILDFRQRIAYIDKVNPSIRSVEYDPAITSTGVELRITADDLDDSGTKGSGIATQGYSFDGGQTWSASPAYYVTENGTVEIAVRDVAGNITYDEVVISNIDDRAPVMTHTINPEGWTNSDVDIVFSAEDYNLNGNQGSGLPEDCFSFDGEEWTSDNSLTVSENGLHVAQVRDRAGRIAEEQVEITNIDKTPPTLSIEKRINQSGKEVSVYVEAQDAESGIDLDSIRWDRGEDSWNSGIINVTENGTYSVSVSDIAGNTTSEEVEITEIVKDIPGGDKPLPPGPTPPTSDVPDIPDVPDTPSDQPPSVDVPIIDEDEPLIPDAPVYDGRVTPGRTPEAEEVAESGKSIEEISVGNDKKLSSGLTSVSREAKKKKGLIARFLDLELWQQLLLILLLLLIVALLGLLLIIWYRSVSLFNNIDDRRQRFISVKWISVSDGRFYVKVRREEWERCETTQFTFVFSWLFLIMHKGDDVCFEFPDDQVRLEHISRSVMVTIR